MTDRELLELAAKSIGMKLDGSHFMLADEGVWNHWQSEYWNPLTDDGDALRLAVKLGMSVFAPDKFDPTAVVQWLDPDNPEREGGNIHVVVYLDDCNNDPYAATRLAIVRAAAEIGKEMK